MTPIYPMVIAGGIVVVAGIFIIVFRARIVAGMTRFHDSTIRSMGQRPEDRPQLTPLTNGRAILWGAGVSCAGIFLIVAGLFRWW